MSAVFTALAIPADGYITGSDPGTGPPAAVGSWSGGRGARR